MSQLYSMRCPAQGRRFLVLLAIVSISKIFSLNRRLDCPGAGGHSTAFRFVPITEAQVGTFAQFGVGTAINVRNTGLIGFIRGDVRTGSKVEGASLTGGLRYTFH